MIRRRGRPASVLAAAVATVAMVVAVASPADAAPDPTGLAERLVRRTSVGDANRHLIAFQRIADTNGGDRAGGTAGYDLSADYVADRLEAAGFIVTRQPFEFDYAELVTAEFERITPPARQYVFSAVNDEGDFAVADFSGSDEVTGVPVPVDVDLPPNPTPPPNSDSGCEAADFTGFPAGSIALIQRGTCTFAVKAANAQEAGASAVILFNEGQPGRTGVVIPGIDPGIDVPVIFTTFAIGSELATAPIEVRINVENTLEVRETVNVIAETTNGRADNVVMAGAHLDSVPEGPGINDNGSGSAALLETALELGSSPRLLNNRVRFAWWGAEEFDLSGSTYYVSQLSFERQLDIALYLNFDMIGSPNAGYFVYDGDGSDGESAPGPFGSAQIEQTFAGFFSDELGVETEGTAFDGRSDYGPFIEVGIPAGGLFTGAEDTKTAAQAAKWGGQAGVDYDPCYHQACDNLGNVDRVALDRNLDAMAWAVGIYAWSTEDINGVPARENRAAARAADAAALSTARAADALTGAAAA